MGKCLRSSASTVIHVGMSGLRPKVNQVQMVRHGAFVEFNADELRKSFSTPSVADGVRSGQSGIVVRVDGDFNGGG